MRCATLWLVVGLLASSPLSAATFQLINTDSAGVGLNDPTPFTPVGGNNAQTLGQARINAFSRALQAWGARISSPVPIRVTASFAPLTCTSNMGTLGQAGPVGYFMNFPGAPLANTYYPSALADALGGRNMNTSNSSEIDAQFNGSVDSNPNCLGGRGFYYGFDHNDGGKIDFPNVLMHEIAHGLGFISLVSPSTGQNPAGSNFIVFDHFVLDLTQNRTFDQMTAAQRQAAAVDSGNLVWAGADTRAQSSQLTSGVNNGYLQLYAPTTVSDGSSVSHWDTAESPDLLMEPFMALDVLGLQSVDFTTCALQDIGWTVTSGCPDGNVVVAAPTANAQSVTTAYVTPVDITLTGSDPVNARLSYQVTGQPTHGALSGTAPSLRYVPATGFVGNDSFTFVTSNGSKSSAPATVSITVQAPTPTANPQSVTTAYGTSVSITLTGSDPANGSLSYQVTSQPSHGTVGGTPPAVTYTPASGYSGADSFTFVVSNGSNSSAAATIAISVAAQNNTGGNSGTGTRTGITSGSGTGTSSGAGSSSSASTSTSGGGGSADPLWLSLVLIPAVLIRRRRASVVSRAARFRRPG